MIKLLDIISEIEIDAGDDIGANFRLFKGEKYWMYYAPWEVVTYLGKENENGINVYHFKLKNGNKYFLTLDILRRKAEEKGIKPYKSTVDLKEIEIKPQITLVIGKQYDFIDQDWLKPTYREKGWNYQGRSNDVENYYNFINDYSGELIELSPEEMEEILTNRKIKLHKPKINEIEIQLDVKKLEIGKAYDFMTDDNVWTEGWEYEGWKSPIRDLNPRHIFRESGGIDITFSDHEIKHLIQTRNIRFHKD